MHDWSNAGIMRRLGKPADWWPADGIDSAESAALHQQCIDLLRSPKTISGYEEVYRVGKKWQAKPYISPGIQRSLGLFDSPRDAAERVFQYHAGWKALPPAPAPRNKRGQGKKKRIGKKAAPEPRSCSPGCSSTAAARDGWRPSAG